MERLLFRQLRRADRHGLNAAGYRNRTLWHIAITFPPNAFPDAPTWTPGPDYVEGREDFAWIRDDGDGWWTAVTGPVWPVATGPGLIGDDPREMVVSVRTDDPWEAFNKPGRYRFEPGAALTPYDDHPLKQVHDYWRAFEHRHGFRPRRHAGPHRDNQSITDFYATFGQDRRGVIFECTGWDDPYEIAAATTRLCRRWGATWRVHPYETAPWSGAYWSHPRPILNAKGPR